MSGMRPQRRQLVWMALSLGALGGLYWFLVGHWRDGHSRFIKWISETLLERWLFPKGFNLLAATPLFYVAVTVIAGFLVYALAPLLTDRRDPSKRHGNERAAIGSVVAALVVVVLISAVLAVRGLWDRDKDGARSYAGATSFVIEDIARVPSSLSSLAEGAREAEGSTCPLRGRHDVFGCLAEADVPDAWERRAVSATGARIVMSRTSGSNQNTQLMGDTLAYLYEANGSGSWTAIRDGRSRQPIFGVVTWDGSGQSVETCRFNGDHALNKAFNGLWGSNLHDEIAGRFPELFYGDEDIWGFCRQGESPEDPAEPVVVIPVTTQQGFAQRTTLRPAGVLVITGSPSGTADIAHVEEVRPGDLPGPVYPISMVAKQRQTTQWAAGRASKNRLRFGFDTVSVESQVGNDSEYLLRSENDGRLYWVTPLKPRGSDSQLLVAYSVTPADAVSSGHLNHQQVFVLDDDDRRLVNLDDMQARVSQAIREQDPGFFTGDSPGRIVEFLPVSDTLWQVYAELGGRVVYRIEVPIDARIQPSVQSLDTNAPEAPPQGGGISAGPATPCTRAFSELSDSELADCLGQLADELRRRQVSPPPSG